MVSICRAKLNRLIDIAENVRTNGIDQDEILPVSRALNDKTEFIIRLAGPVQADIAS